MKIEYQSLEKKLKINFKNKSLLIQSLTHKSFSKDKNNEKISESIKSLEQKILSDTMILVNNFLINDAN